MSVAERVQPLERYAGPENVALPAGYRIEPVATGLNYPTSVTWDGDGNLLVAESTVPFGRVARTEIRILRRAADGSLTPVAGGFAHLINDIAVHEGRLYVSQRGRISVVEAGRLRDLITGLPSWGMHHNSALAFGPDGRLYFGQGTITNAGAVDSYALGDLRRSGHLGDHDIPGASVVLTGHNYQSTDLLATGETRIVGAFSPWGTPTTPGERRPGPAPGQAASGAIMSANPDGSDLRVYAWGLRNPYGLAFAPDGRLYATNNGANRIPPRRISADPDALWRVEEGAWYGWPDYYAGQPVTEPSFKPPDAPRHPFLIANHDELLKGRPRPPGPVLSFGLHVAPTKLDFCRRPDFGFAGQAFVPLFGSMLTSLEQVSASLPLGHKVVRVDVAEGSVSDFATNRSGRPASASGSAGGLERPIQARFGPDGALYIVDFGILELPDGGWVAHPGTGTVWRVTRSA